MKAKRKPFKVLVAVIAIGMLMMGLPLMASAADGSPVEPSPGKVSPTDPTEGETRTIHMSYDLNGGEWEPGEEIGPYAIETTIGKNILAEEFKGEGVTPVKDGYTFLGWGYSYTDMEGNILYNSEDPEFWDFDYGWVFWEEDFLEANILFTAVWEKDSSDATKPDSSVRTIHMSYDLNGGEWEPGEEIGPYAIETTIGEDILAEEFKGEGVTPVKDGYTFLGWGYSYTDMEGNILYGISFNPEDPEFWDFDYGWAYGEEDPLEANILFTAVWEKDSSDATKPDSSKNGNRSGKVSKVATKTPKTGDSDLAGIMAIVMLIGATATVGLAKRKFN